MVSIYLGDGLTNAIFAWGLGDALLAEGEFEACLLAFEGGVLGGRGAAAAWEEVVEQHTMPFPCRCLFVEGATGLVVSCNSSVGVSLVDLPGWQINKSSSTERALHVVEIEGALHCNYSLSPICWFNWTTAKFK